MHAAAINKVDIIIGTWKFDRIKVITSGKIRKKIKTGFETPSEFEIGLFGM